MPVASCVSEFAFWVGVTVVVPTYQELNAALDELGELLKKYVSLFEATILATVAPVHQEDWKAPFRVAWIKD